MRLLKRKGRRLPIVISETRFSMRAHASRAGAAGRLLVRDGSCQRGRTSANDHFIEGGEAEFWGRHLGRGESISSCGKVGHGVVSVPALQRRIIRG
jgi:hypothetical protein